MNFQDFLRIKVIGKELIPAVLFLITFALALHPPQIHAEVKQASVPSMTLDKVILQLKWFHQFNFAGYYAAVEKGFYRDVGLDVIIKEGQPGMDFVEEIISGQADYGVEMPELLIARHNGKAIVVLAAIFQHSPQIILARADSGIRSPQNLIGKKVMWRYDSAAELRSMLISEKTPLKSIDFVELSWDINDLIDRKVDAVHAYITDQPFALQKAGIESVSLSPITYGIDFYGDCLFTSEKELSEHPERVKAFREASLRGWEYAMENPEELMEIIQEEYSTKSSIEYMRYEFKHMNNLIIPKLIEIGHMNPGRWKHIGDTFVNLGMLDPSYSLDGFLYDPNPRSDYTKIMKVAWTLFVVTLVISLGAMSLFVFNRKLNREVQERTNHLSVEIDARKRVEKKFLKQYAEFQAIFSSITDAIVFVNSDRHILMINPSFESIFGYNLEEVKGKTTQFLYANPEEYHLQGKLRFHKGSQSDKPVYEIKYRCKDGSVIPSETLGVPVKDSGGKTIGFLAVIRDASERKQAEREKADLETQLRQAYKMEAIGTMAGGIAHDFNNILSIIINSTEMSLLNIPEESQTYYYNNMTLKAAHRAKELVKQILAFSRQSSPELVPVKPHLILKENLRLVRSTIPASVEIQEDIESRYGFINADPTQIHQLVMNLCTNAVHAMDDKGILTAKLKEVMLSSEDLAHKPELKPGKYAQLSITDDGCGMDQKTLDRIFDPFFTTKETGAGTGLGLAVIHGIVEAHGGMITVESKLGEGTTFHIFFPIIDSGEIRAEEIPEQLPRGNERILFVDDEEMLAETGGRILERLGYNVTIKSGSNDAFETFKSNPEAFDIVITDQSMPNMSGTELAAEILKTRPEIPIILCTGYSKKISEGKAKDMGIREFCTKPLDGKELAHVVRKVLDENNVS